MFVKIKSSQEKHFYLLPCFHQANLGIFSHPSQSRETGTSDPLTMTSHPEANPLPTPIDHGFGIPMDEEMSEIELGDLDLLGLEDTCTKKDSRYIPSYEIQLLKESLANIKTNLVYSTFS